MKVQLQPTEKLNWLLIGLSTNHMAQSNLLDVVNCVILKFPAVLKIFADDL